MTGRSSRLFRVALAAILGFLVVGCGAGGTPVPGYSASLTPSPQQPTSPAQAPASPPATGTTAGWMEYEQPEDGFAIALPESWRRINPDPASLASVLEVLRRQHPEAAALLESAGQRLEGSDVRFIAFDLGPESMSSGFLTNLNVLHRPLQSGTTLSSFGEANVSELERMARLATPVEQHMVQWPSGQALCLQYTLALDTPQGQLADLSLTQFLVVHGQDGYVLTFATTPGQLARYAPIFEQIGRTFRLLRA